MQLVQNELLSFLSNTGRSIPFRASIIMLPWTIRLVLRFFLNLLLLSWPMVDSPCVRVPKLAGRRCTLRDSARRLDRSRLRSTCVLERLITTCVIETRFK